MAKGDKPTLKQKKFAKAYVENGGNATQAALETYNTQAKQAKVIGYQNINKPVVKKTIEELLNKNGLNLEKLTELTTSAIKNNLKNGKPSQAVGADLLKFTYKLHNALPDKTTRIIRENKKIIMDKDYNTLKTELEQTVSLTTELLNDL